MNSKIHADIITFISKPITTADFADKKPLSISEINKDKNDTDNTLKNYHAKFYGSFQADTDGKYEILISADDYYKLYINNKFVCMGPRPAYPSRYNYNLCDISEYITDGENEICVHVYYQGLVNRVWVSGDNRMMLIADIFRNGSHIAGTEIFKRCIKINGYAAKNTIGYQTQFSEDFDFNIRNEERKICVYGGRYNFHSEPMPVVDVTRICLNPNRINNKTASVDIGREIAASLSLNIRGRKGQTVYIRRGEETDDGVRYDMRCNCLYEDCLILSGSADFYDEFDYKAFRYIEIVSDEPYELGEISVNVRHNKFKERLRIKTDDMNLSSIWWLCADTLKYGVQETFIDCPTREKGEYFGDFTVSGLACLHLTGDSGIYKRTLMDFADTARLDKGLLAVGSCSYIQEIADFSLMLPLQMWSYYRLTKDCELISQLMNTADGMLEYFSVFERGDGLLEDVNTKWNLVDWPENLRDGYDASLDGSQKHICHNVINAYYIGAHIMRDRLADALGIKPLGKAQRLADVFNKEFLDSERGIYTDTSQTSHAALHSNALPLFYGFAPSSAVDTTAKYIEDKGLSCGVFFSYFVLKALTLAGRRESALRLIKDNRYWLNMISEGATTTFEAWGKEQKWNTSLCHPWACAPIIIIAENFPELTKEIFTK